jgi:uncharacterized protein YndB with AHSA1/START domain
MTPDLIERETVIDAPRTVVWAIITEAEHIANWFSDEAEIQLQAGGRMLLTWRGHGSYEGRVESVEPPHRFAFRWQTREGKFSETNSTLVVMTLEDEDEHTRLRVVESGFASIPLTDEARARYVDENTNGWRIELDELRNYAALIVDPDRDL